MKVKVLFLIVPINKTTFKQPVSVGYDPREDRVLGDYFSNYFDSCADFQIEITKPEDSGYSRAMPTEAFCLWEQGWYDAVTEFWHTIQTYDNQEM